MFNLPGQIRNWCIPVLTLILTLPAHAGVLFDRAFFDGKPNTFIDFEALPDGTVLSDLTTDPFIILANDAFSDLNITTFNVNAWAEVQALNARPGVQFAHAQAGSSDMLLETGAVLFIEPVRAFMLFAADVSWGGDAILNIGFEDGTGSSVSVEQYMQKITDPTIASDKFRYGVVGFASDSALGITAVSFSSGITFIDDVQFTMIPAPGTMMISLPMVVVGVRRRRR